MSRIFSTKIALTSQQLIEQFAHADYQDYIIEAWLFADRQHRQQAETELLALGISATFRSAYKPLLHFFLEELPVPLRQLSQIDVHYPLHPAASEKRFLLETYPLAALVGNAKLQFIPNGSLTDTYDVILHASTGEKSQHKVFAPNHLQQHVSQQSHLSPTGWLKITDATGKISTNERLITDYEMLFHGAMGAISKYDWEKTAPYFEELNIRANLPWKDEPLAYGHEAISLGEALHEDLYFSTQEWFKQQAGSLCHGQSQNRRERLGQIVPEICHAQQRSQGSLSQDKHVSIEIETRPYQSPFSEEVTPETAVKKEADQDLAKASAPLSMAQVESELAQIKGMPFHATSISSRQVQARYHQGSDLPVMISGGQHANETSGVVGALRAAQLLSQNENSHFTGAPLENPDGYALHQRLIADNPHHMHHAARYTALGDDLEYRIAAPFYEKEIRHQAQALSQAKLHINLHGYPAHEWTRPLSGYVPYGFDMWTIPKGFFLILRHSSVDHWPDYAEEFIHLVTEKLADMKDVIKMNKQQMALYQHHAGDNGFRIINHFPCLIANQQEPATVPIQLVTEYPDETIYGKDFLTAHEIQTATVLAAYQAHQVLGKKFL